MTASATATQIAPVSTKAVQKGNVFDRFDQICNSIAKRAFETVESNGRKLGDEFGDWFKAESELLPPLHAEKALRDTENQLRTLAESLESQVQLCTQELEARNIEIAQQAEQLRELSNRLQHTQDEERRRIARELHDSVGQVVTALGIHLARITQVAAEPAVQKAAEESREMVRQLGTEIRTVSYLLHPPLLDENGLPDALQWYTDGLVQRSGLKIVLEISTAFGRLPDAIEVAVFRIVQECLTNIHRHSGAKRATIRLARDVSTVVLEIRDDGSGIAKDTLAAILTQRSGIGIAGMRERVRHLRGDLDIQSDSTGTTVSISLPCATGSVSDVEIADKANVAA